MPIPLQEVFQNLPANALSIRADQVTEEPGMLYPTPFSQKADEDAQRFGMPVAPVLPPAGEVVPSEPEASKEEAVADSFTSVCFDDRGGTSLGAYPGRTTS